MRSDQREQAQRITGKPYAGDVEVHHLLDVLVNRFGLDGIRQKVQRRLAGLRVACYYGCLLTRPPEVVAFDNPENPNMHGRPGGGNRGGTGRFGPIRQSVAGRACRSRRAKWWGVWVASCS